MPALPLAFALATPVLACDPMPGWEEVAQASADKYLVLGEAHGSAEAPTATAELVCSLAQDGPVLLAIEFSSSTNAAWQRAWAAPHAEFRARLFAEVSEWGERNDGVASEAMLAMLVRLHALKDAGADIDIVAFNGARDDAQRAAFAGLPGQEPHEAAQAANIREAGQQRDYGHVVVLVGNLHAEKTPITLNGIDIRPMANLLAEADRIVSLAMHTDGGETWGCQLGADVEFDPGKPITTEMLDCSAQRIGPDRDPRTRGFHLDPAMASRGFDGVFALGPVTASPLPAID